MRLSLGASTRAEGLDATGRKVKRGGLGTYNCGLLGWDSDTQATTQPVAPPLAGLGHR